ncbi:hypothetical protein THRCLA_01271 [Thraustotheca clavata]|uniref:AP2/ERF domain-containing protein n=1 Tax=Thraustotheca clavata TaxID=74557 RepID=A0A1W0A8T6_9STRA|nr:hypothetical protein THRCLA_01271 [Thraustotheca clavata]
MRVFRGVRHAVNALKKSSSSTALKHVRLLPVAQFSLHQTSVRELHLSRTFFKNVDEEKEITEISSEQDDEKENEEDDNEDEDVGVPSEKFIGVTFHESRIKKWSASLEIGEVEVDAGQFWTEEDAAKGYDELVRMYLDESAPVNFKSEEEDLPDPNSPSYDWSLPDAGSRHADIITPIPQTPMTMEELLPALEREQAIDIYTIDLAGKSNLAEYMVFCTGRTRNHMRRMADMVIMSMKARNMQDNFGYIVEGRDSDDWMIADIDNIVVHFMTHDTRKMLQLENHWENMVDNKHRVYGDWSEDEYMDRYGMSELMTDDDVVQEDDIDHTVWK